MRFMVMVKGNPDYEAGQPPSPELMTAVGNLTRDHMAAGIVVDTGGLYPSSKGALIRASGGNLTVIDGPFAETKEVIGGYAIIEAKSKEEAIQHARQFMQVHIDVLGPSYEGECELAKCSSDCPFAIG